VTENQSWSLVDSGVLAGTVLWRTFRWYRGQRHYSGSYWSATMRDHVIYESRLELSRLIFADFDRSVHRILAQPFLLKAKIDGKIRKHIPDYFLVGDHGPVVVDVKPRGGLVVGAGLEGEQFGVEPAGGHELAVGPAFGELPAVEDGDEVGHAHGGEAVGDEHGDAAVFPSGLRG